MNVVYLTADSLRFDHISYFNPDSPVSTPNIDELAREGLAFERAYSNGPHTTLSAPTMLTGEYQPAISGETPTLAESLQSAGYSTAGICTNVQLVGYKLNHMQLWRGFDEFDTMLSAVRQRSEVKIEKAAGLVGSTVESTFGSDSLPFRVFTSVFPYLPLPMTVPTPHAGAVNERALEWLDDPEVDEPFFLWVFNLDTHEPWMPPTEDSRGIRDRIRRHRLNRKYRYFESALDENEQDLVRDLYAESVAYWDRKVGELVSAIRERTNEPTTFVVTSDHGELLGEYGTFGHSGGPEDELLHVPLIVSGDGVEAADVHSLVQNIDVVATIADLAETSVPENVRGKSLLSMDEFADRRGVLSLLSVDPLTLAYRTDEWQYVRTEDDEQLYATDEERRVDVAHDHPSVVVELADEVDSLLADVSFDVERPDDVTVDPEIQDRLHSLGYLDE